MAFIYPGMSSCAIQSNDLSASIDRTVPRAAYRCEGGGEGVLALMLAEGVAIGGAPAASRGLQQSSSRLTSKKRALLGIRVVFNTLPTSTWAANCRSCRSARDVDTLEPSYSGHVTTP